ncbi:MAG: M23 family metallopeptidase [Bacteroidia bacterium]
MGRKIYFILFCMLLGIVKLSANYRGGNTDTVSIENGKDTLPNFSHLHYDSDDYYPSSELYGEWDTINTHFKKLSLAELNALNEKIILCDENSCGYVHPFLGRVTSDFGVRKNKFHYGIDIDLETGDKVDAAFDGKVRIARRSVTYGNVIVIRHENGLETYYAHLSQINVNVGDEVYAGQAIGLGGNTGRSHGSHLHFEVRYLGNPINPNDIISFDEQKLKLNTFCVNKSTFSDYTKYKLHHNMYVVKRGDTLSGIAQKNGTTIKSITKKNRLKNTAVLRLGQRLTI